MINGNKRPLGFWTSMSLVVGNIIGSGIFLIPAALAAYGSISLWSWVFSSVGAILLALVFSRLNRQIPHTGGAFLYAYHVYGEFVAFAIAGSYWFSWCVGIASTAIPLVGFFGLFWPSFDHNDPHWSPLAALFLKIGVVWLGTIINILGIKLVGRLQLITTILKFTPLVLIAVIGLYHMQWSNLGTFYNISGQSNWVAFTGGAALTLYAFIGLESAVVPADEISNPRTIAKATVIGTALCGLIYIGDTLVMLGLFPATTLKNSASPFADAATYLFGPVGAYLIAITAIISIVGCISGSILVQVQDAMAAADRGLFPKIFAKRGRFQTATWGFIISAVIMTSLLLMTASNGLMEQFTFLVLLTTLSMLIPYFVSSVAELMLLLKHSKQFNRRKLIANMSIAFLGSMFAFLMMLGSGKEVLSAGCLLFFALFWFYWLLKVFRPQAAAPVKK